MIIINSFAIKNTCILLYLFLGIFIVDNWPLYSTAIILLSIILPPILFENSPYSTGERILSSITEDEGFKYYLSVTPRVPAHDTESVKDFSFDLESAKMQVQFTDS